MSDIEFTKDVVEEMKKDLEVYNVEPHFLPDETQKKSEEEIKEM